MKKIIFYIGLLLFSIGLRSQETKILVHDGNLVTKGGQYVVFLSFINSVNAGQDTTICSDSVPIFIGTHTGTPDSLQWRATGTLGTPTNDTTTYTANATTIANGGDTATFTAYYKGDSINDSFYITIYDCGDDTVLQSTILVNHTLSSTWQYSQDNWNNVYMFNIYDLVDSLGNVTDLDYGVYEFNGTSTGGYNSGDNSCVFPDSVMIPALYTLNGATRFTSLLNATADLYKIELMTSKASGQSPTTFIVNKTDSVTLNWNVDNCDTLATFWAVPNAGDSITIDVACWSGTSAVINGMRVKTYNINPYVAQYYVAPWGNNGNDGSYSSPFLTIAYAESQMSGGDSVYVRGGTYNERIFINGIDGTWDDKTYFLAYPNESPVITGTGLADDGLNRLIAVWDSCIVIDGFEIKKSNYGTAYSGGEGIYGVTTSNKLTVQNCTIDSCGSSGIVIEEDSCIVQDNTIFDVCMKNYEGAAVDWGAGITFHGEMPTFSTDNGIIRRNTVYNCWGEGISIAETLNSIVEDNTIYDFYSVGLYVMNSQNAIVQRNFVYTTKDMADGSQPGIGMWNEVSYIKNENNNIINNISVHNYKNFSASILNRDSVINNTFVNSQLSYGVDFWYTGDTAGYFINNVIVQEGALPCINAPADTGLHFSYNLYNKSYDADAAGDGDVTGDIDFTETGGDSTKAVYYQIQATSDAVDAGVDVSVDYDYAEDARDASPDIGAYEYQWFPFLLLFGLYRKKKKWYEI